MVKNRQNARDDSQIGRREATTSSAGPPGTFIPEGNRRRTRERGSASNFALLRLVLFSCVLLIFLPLLGVGFAAEAVAPEVSISSPEDGFVTSQGTLEVTVDFKASANSEAAKPTGNVTAVILKMNNEEVGHYNNPPQINEGTHVFEVDISSLSDGPVTLQAFAYQGDSRAKREGKSESVSVTIDRTAPEIKGILTPEPNENGWNNSDVTVSFEASDELSGIAEVSPDVEVTEEGESQTFTGTATDKAGNTTATTVTVSLDKTGPNVEAEVTPDANAEGWHREDPTVSFKATDELSGIEEISPETKVSSEGKDQTVEGTAIDNAGNSTSVSEKVSLDKSPPEISNLRPEEGASLNDLRPTTSADFSDNLSGVDTDTARLTLDGKAVEGFVSVTPEGLSFKPEEDLSQGEHTVAVNVSDLAMNAAEEEMTTFTVEDGGPPDGTNLTVLPSTLRVKDVGTTAPLTVYLEKDGELTDVSKDPETTYESSNQSVVLVDETGSMTFAGEGEAEVTVRNGGLQAVTNIEVDANAPELIEGLIGPAGGNVTLPNGTGVSIPEDALAEKKTIRVEESSVSPDSFLPEDGVPVGKAYDFSPDGLTFDEPISIAIRYEPAHIPSGYDEESMLISTLDSNGRWVFDGPQPTSEDDPESGSFGIDLVRHAVQVTTNHFSKRSITIDKAPISQETLDPTPDGTTLRVIKVIKQEKTCNGTAEPIPDRAPGQSIDYAVLHNTSNPGKILKNGSIDFSYQATFNGEVRYAAGAEKCTWGAYYVDKDGTIVQLSEDKQIVNHIGYSGHDPSNPSKNISKLNSIGIEIFNNHCGPTSTPTHCADPAEYPGAQVSGVVRLVDYLMRKHPSIDPPGPYDPALPTGPRNTLNRGNIRMHTEIPTGPRDPRSDPEGNFQTGTMGPPSLEEIIYHALREDHKKGAITTKGGDAFGVAVPGKGGNVDLRFGDPTLENDPDNARDTLVVPAGDVVEFSGPTELMHLIVNGRLEITEDTTLDVDGVYYVGPNGKIDASGTARSPEGPNGHSLTIQADGFGLIEGLIDTSGADREAPFPGDPNLAHGGAGGDFTLRTAAPGPVWVPTIITRGGDADESLPSLLPPVGGLKSGGKGGNVSIQAVKNKAEDRVSMHFQGREDFQGSGLFPADRLPVPPPFNQMPIVTANPGDPPSEAACKRPTAGERLTLGREGAAIDGANISTFKRGILTVGGIGGTHDDRTTPGAPGGDGGSITVENQTQGRMLFKDVDFFTGAGVEQLCYQITIPNGGVVKRYMAPSGGLGAKGALNGGHGGAGGKGGDITIKSEIDHLRSPSKVSVLGHNGADPNSNGSYSRTVIGQTLIFTDSFIGGNTLLETNSTGGSGGSPGGGASGRSGSFGAKGADGITQVQGSILYP